MVEEAQKCLADLSAEKESWMKEVIRFEEVIRRLEGFEQLPVSIMLLCYEKIKSGPSALTSFMSTCKGRRHRS